MRLLNVRCENFAGLPDRAELALRPGLNVVLGPNESGKSTFFRAISHGLFTPTTLSKLQVADQLGRLFPAAGGNVMAVEVTFEDGSGRYVLRREWSTGGKAKGQTSLQLPGGAKVVGEEQVAHKLAGVLPAGPGTCRQLLLVPQAELARTVETLKAERQTLRDLADIMAATVHAGAGVSFEHLRQRLDERIAAHFERWNIELNRPEDPSRVYVKSVGTLLRAWYALENCRKELDKAQQLEKEYERLQQDLDALAREAAGHAQWLSDNAAAIADAPRRSELQLALDNSGREQKAASDAFAEWTSLEAQVPLLEKALDTGGARLKQLQDEYQSAKLEADNAALRRKWQAVQKAEEALAGAKRTFEAVPLVSQEDIQALRQAAREIARCEALIAGGRMRVCLRAVEPLSIALAADTAPPRQEQIPAGEERVFEAAARLTVTHSAWSMEALSGKGDVSATLAALSHANAEYKRLLEKLNAADLAQAEAAARHCTELAVQVRAAAGAVEQALDGESREALASRHAALGEPRTLRPLEHIAEDRATQERDLKEAGKQLDRSRSRLAELEKEYVSKDSALQRMAAAQLRATQARNELDALAPLPPGFADGAALIREAERRRSLVDGAKTQAAQAKEKLIRVEGEMAASDTVEALTERLTEQRAAFAAAESTGRALLRVREALQSVAAVAGRSPFEKLGKEFQGFLSQLCPGRFADAVVEDGLPGQLTTSAGAKLTPGHLSAGTAGSVALALRLALAGQVIAGQQGFLLMDDPLVDMDPVRQKAAAKVLADFAKSHQLVVFTCHPDHAALLGGATEQRSRLG